MNEYKKDDLLSAFENPETDPTPDIKPVMPDTNVQNNNAVPGQVDTSSMLPPELANAPEAIPVQPTPVVPTTPVVPAAAPVTPEATTSVAPAVANATDTSNATTDVSKDADGNEQSIKPNAVAPEADPAISVTKNIKDEPEQDDPNFLKKNIKFILIIFAIIIAFILLLPTVLNLLGAGY